MPFAKADLISILYDKGKVAGEEHVSEGIIIEVEMEELWARRVEAMLKE